MRRFMDVLFNGYVYIKRHVFILGDLTSIIFKGNENKDFSIKRTPEDKIYLSRANETNPLHNFGYFDCNTGVFVVLNFATTNTVPPQPHVGGLYFNSQTNTWYKCEDGENWVEANI